MRNTDRHVMMTTVKGLKNVLTEKDGEALNAKQFEFVRLYVETLDPTKSYMAVYRVEYKVASANASRLLANAKIKKILDKVTREKLARLNISSDFIIDRCVEIHEKCMGNIPVLDRQGNPIGEYRIDSRGALEALKLLTKYKTISKDFAEKVDVEHSGSITLESILESIDKPVGE